ncbi:hypothetical protein M408DRAFT_181553, partial [Serendipita vermifera MAFF 305830]
SPLLLLILVKFTQTPPYPIQIPWLLLETRLKLQPMRNPLHILKRHARHAAGGPPNQLQTPQKRQLTTLKTITIAARAIMANAMPPAARSSRQNNRKHSKISSGTPGDIPLTNKNKKSRPGLESKSPSSSHFPLRQVQYLPSPMRYHFISHLYH